MGISFWGSIGLLTSIPMTVQAHYLNLGIFWPENWYRLPVICTVPSSLTTNSVSLQPHPLTLNHCYLFLIDSFPLISSRTSEKDEERLPSLSIRFQDIYCEIILMNYQQLLIRYNSITHQYKPINPIQKSIKNNQLSLPNDQTIQPPHTGVNIQLTLITISDHSSKFYLTSIKFLITYLSYYFLLTHFLFKYADYLLRYCQA